MWSIVLLVNSFILTFVSLYFIYSIGMAVLIGAWKAFFIALIMLLFFTFTEVAIGSISE